MAPQLCSQPWLITPFHRVSRLYEFLSYWLRVFQYWFRCSWILQTCVDNFNISENACVCRKCDLKLYINIYVFFSSKKSMKYGPAFQLFLKYIIKQMQALGYNCGQNISFNWYIHLIQKVSDAPEFCLFVKRNLTFFFWIVLYL